MKKLKLIVKLSEGSVRDALSLLDRVLLSDIDRQITFEKPKKYSDMLIETPS